MLTPAPSRGETEQAETEQCTGRWLGYLVHDDRLEDGVVVVRWRWRSGIATDFLK